MFKWNLNRVSVSDSLFGVLSLCTDEKSLVPSPPLASIPAEPLQPQGSSPSLSLARARPSQFPLMQVGMEIDFSAVIQNVWLSPFPCAPNTLGNTAGQWRWDRKQLLHPASCGTSLGFGSVVSSPKV